jgi:flavin reductase (DIM6/NTAB) family NADH-FMN oxidoreductase RutF
VEIGDGTAGSGFVVIGSIVLFHIDDDVYDNGRILLDKLQPLGRLAGNWYTRTTDILKIIRKIKPDK